MQTNHPHDLLPFDFSNDMERFLLGATEKEIAVEAETHAASIVRSLTSGKENGFIAGVDAADIARDQQLLRGLHAQAKQTCITALGAHAMWRRNGSHLYHLSTASVETVLRNGMAMDIPTPPEGSLTMTRPQGYVWWANIAEAVRLERPIVSAPTHPDDPVTEMWGFYAMVGKRPPDFDASHFPHGHPLANKSWSWALCLLPVCAPPPGAKPFGAHGSEGRMGRLNAWIGSVGFYTDATLSYEMREDHPSLRWCLAILGAIWRRKSKILPYTPRDHVEARHIARHRADYKRVDLSADAFATYDRHLPPAAVQAKQQPLAPTVAHEKPSSPTTPRDLIVIVPDHAGVRWCLESSCTTEQIQAAIAAERVQQRPGKPPLYGIPRPIRGWQTNGTRLPAPKITNIKTTTEIL